MAPRVLEELEVREAVTTDRHQFAVDHSIVLDALQRFRDFDVVVADDLAVAAIESDLPAFDCCDHAKAVILVLKYPVLIIKRSINKRGEHRLQAFRQCRDTRHDHALRGRIVTDGQGMQTAAGVTGRYCRGLLLFKLDVAVGETRRGVFTSMRSSMPSSPP